MRASVRRKVDCDIRRVCLHCCCALCCAGVLHAHTTAPYLPAVRVGAAGEKEKQAWSGDGCFSTLPPEQEGGLIAEPGNALPVMVCLCALRVGAPACRSAAPQRVAVDVWHWAAIQTGKWKPAV